MRKQGKNGKTQKRNVYERNNVNIWGVKKTYVNKTKKEIKKKHWEQKRKNENESERNKYIK